MSPGKNSTNTSWRSWTSKLRAFFSFSPSWNRSTMYFIWASTWRRAKHNILVLLLTKHLNNGPNRPQGAFGVKYQSKQAASLRFNVKFNAYRSQLTQLWCETIENLLKVLGVIFLLGNQLELLLLPWFNSQLQTFQLVLYTGQSCLDAVGLTELHDGKHTLWTQTDMSFTGSLKRSLGLTKSSKICGCVLICSCLTLSLSMITSVMGPNCSKYSVMSVWEISGLMPLTNTLCSSWVFLVLRTVFSVWCFRPFTCCSTLGTTGQGKKI